MWNEHPSPDTYWIAGELVQIGNSIWCSTWYNQGEEGLVEFCEHGNNFKHLVSYPAYVEATRHALCCLNNLIYIIDGKNRQIVSFNPSTYVYTMKLRIAQIGVHPSAIVINDEIHIYHGKSNNSSLSYVYNPKCNAIRKVEDKFAAEGMEGVAIIKYRNELIRLGGWNADNYRYTDRVLYGYDCEVIVNGYIHDNFPVDIVNLIVIFYQKGQYHWEICHELKLRYKMYSFGYILYDHWIVTFGGVAKVGGITDHIDNIFILDLMDKKRGWIESDVGCPAKDGYKAILTSNNVAHLFGSGHYSISLSSIMTDIDINSK